MATIKDHSTFNMVKVSIIVPVYNVEKYIERCLLSIIKQTYIGCIECIIVDDCGRDNSMTIADKIVTEYKGNIRFFIIHHKYNRGLSAARNSGLDVATGDYIYYLDSDDELPADAIQLMVEEVNNHPNIELVQGYTQSVPMTDNYDTSCFKDHQYVTDNTWFRENFYCTGKTIPVNGVNKLIKCEFLKRNNLYFKEGIIHEDEHWMFYLVQKLSSMAFIFKPTYIRYFNEGSIMSTLTEEKTGKSWSVILLDWVDNIDNISAKKQLKIILFWYTKRGVWKYSSNDKLFLKKLITSLWKNSEIKCLMFLCLALLLRPFNKGIKCLRYAQEAIYV